MKINRFLFAVMALALCLLPTVPSALASGEGSTAETSGTPSGTSKNETVYAMLNSDGSVDRIYVVNQLFGEYTDYGTYTDIKNLSTSSVPTVQGDKITFPDEYVEGGLYYQGTMTGELPLTFDIDYKLDGKPTSAESLAGAAGRLQLSITASPNEKCDPAVREGLMAQITVQLDTRCAENISAPDATVVIVGKTTTINYIVLPGESGMLAVTADVQDFHMDATTITLLKGTIAASGIDEKLDEFDDGFDDMLSGANDMVDGTTELKDGMSSLVDGMGSLNRGLGKLNSGGKTLVSGMSEYGDKLDSFLVGVEGLAQASAGIQSGLSDLSENGEAIAQGISDISANLSGLSEGSAQLKALAKTLAGSADPNVAALADGVLQTLGAVEGLADGLKTASAGLNSYMSGVAQAATEYGKFHAGLQELAEGGSQLGGAYDEILSGVKDYAGGVSKSAAGAKTFYNAIKTLPDDIQTLIDGQIEFRDGIAEARDEINETVGMFVPDDDPPVSFASPLKNRPASVQYILTTPAIEKKKVSETQQAEETAARENFFTRLADLFK
jgi:putative membrane protein